MTNILLTIVAVFCVVQVVLAVLVLLRLQANRSLNVESGFAQLASLMEKSDRTLREEFSHLRTELSQQAKDGREESSRTIATLGKGMRDGLMDMAGLQKEQLVTFAGQLESLSKIISANSEALRVSIQTGMQTLQAETSDQGIKAREQAVQSLKELTDQSAQARAEIGKSMQDLGRLIGDQMAAISTSQKDQLQAFAAQLTALNQGVTTQLDGQRESIERKLSQLQTEATTNATQTREQSSRSLKEFSESQIQLLTNIAGQQKNQLDLFATQVNQLSQGLEQRMEVLRSAVDEKLKGIQADNAQKLEVIRATVDEKLHATLEQRLGESFKLVSERLELVHQGLGEMQSLATGVGDLKKVLSNVKTRGTWGEMKLGTLLEELLTPDQYCRNIKTNPNSNDPVEFAIKLPGRGGSEDSAVYLPIDAKFPKEDYERLVDAQEMADPELAEAAGKALENRIRSEAQAIHEKYICPPHTTDFAILFLATESLYAEVLRRPGLAESLQRQYRVSVSGPSCFAALLNSLQMGFRTLAIEKRSSEVWQVLGAIKTEFGKFGDALDKVQQKLQEASNNIDKVGVRSRAIQRKLKTVQELPAETAKALLGAEIVDDTVEE